MQDLDWNNLKFILALWRSGTLAGAGRILGVNESTVARRIAGAEERLQTRLFERIPGGLSPTGAGKSAIASAERIEKEADALQSAIGGTDLRISGSVRLTAVPILLNHLLVPALPGFLGQHPDLRIELLADSNDLSLVRREADVALRLARPTREMAAVARKVGQLDYAVYAASAPIETDYPWIVFDDSMSLLPHARWLAKQTRHPGTRTDVRVAVNDMESALAAVRAGLGKTLLPVAIAATDCSLSRIDESVSLSREMWVVTHPEYRKLPRIQVVNDWVSALARSLQDRQAIS